MIDFVDDRNKEEIVKGWVLGDANIVGRDRRNSTMVCTSKNRDFLLWTKNKLGNLTRTIKKDESNDLYKLYSRSSSFFTKYANWYDGKKKVFPDKVKLTKESLRVWYCCDGGLKMSNRRGKILSCQMYCLGNIHNGENIVNWFNDIGLEPNLHSKSLSFTGEDKEKLLDFMGDPLPGFEYKWEINDIDRYKELKPD